MKFNNFFCIYNFFLQFISIKRKEELSVVTCGISCKVSFALLVLRSCLLYIQGSRKSNNEYEKLNEIPFNAITIVKRNGNQKYSYN